MDSPSLHKGLVDPPDINGMQGGTVEIVDPPTVATASAIRQIHTALWAIGGGLFVAFVTMLFMLAGLLLDAWRAKEASYTSLSQTLLEHDRTIQEQGTQLRDIGEFLQATMPSPPASVE